MPLIRIRWQDAQRIADEPTGPVELQLIDDGNRNAKNRPYAASGSTGCRRSRGRLS